MAKAKEVDQAEILREIDTLFELNEVKGTYIHHLFEELKLRGELKKFRIQPTIRFVGKHRLEKLVKRIASCSATK